MALYRNIAGSSVGLFIEPETGLYYGNGSGLTLAPLPYVSPYDTPIIDVMSVPATNAPVQQTINNQVTEPTVTNTGAVTTTADTPTTVPPPTTESKLDWLPLVALAAAVAIAVEGDAFVPGNKKLFFAGSIGLLYYASITHHG